MKQHVIRARGKRKFKATTDSNHALPVAPILLARDFSPATPNAAWTSEITYIATDEGWRYLAVIPDLFNRQVVGWSMKPHMRQDLVVDALRMAWFRCRPAPGLIMHSDRGSRYCGKDFTRAIKAYGVPVSMSRKGDCRDNAPTQSLWGSLKVRRLYGMKFPTRRAAMDERACPMRDAPLSDDFQSARRRSMNGSSSSPKRPVLAAPMALEIGSGKRSSFSRAIR